MAEVFGDDDADLAWVQDRNVAVLGYGSYGRAHALSLRDSGVDVRVGVAEGSSQRTEAEAAGLRVVSPYEACEEADLVTVLTSATAQLQLFVDAVQPNLVEGDALVFGSGFAVRYGAIEPPDGVDVVLVASKGPGHLVRSEFEEGRGVPVLVAVDRDAAGHAWQLAMSYAKAIGGTRAGAISTTFAEATEAAVFAEQAVRSGGVPALVLAGFETLTEAGYQPELAYLECVNELKLTVDGIFAGGLARRRQLVSDLEEYAGYTAGSLLVDESVKHRMQELLAGIRDGSWGADFNGDQDAGAPKLAEHRRRSEQHPIEPAGRQVRQLMSRVDSTSNRTRPTKDDL